MITFTIKNEKQLSKLQEGVTLKIECTTENTAYNR